MHRMREINFPILADNDGSFSRSLGVLNLKTKGSCRALAILNPDYQLLYMAVNNETVFSEPGQIIQQIKQYRNQSQVNYHFIGYHS